ncbi:hypothetical protein GCM10011571_29880 [Marinithermofilum abyssi]|jgi:hypothetical protein|uniref:Antitoxin VbhA domain-containing protein n=1 Tax=Marinithermofilum abyssi TaxID=1571185 RepID=A0A8J2VI16_9BACL|nr:hypothetical protein [Marinithermofilum abyssi]GGE25788.1 hypothetical protein GCM10011571_29880 [Marinithermofilum abyssi]
MSVAEKHPMDGPHLSLERSRELNEKYVNGEITRNQLVQEVIQNGFFDSERKALRKKYARLFHK